MSGSDVITLKNGLEIKRGEAERILETEIREKDF
ncbi:hypothetical protein BMS3Bbin16_00185 [archaeon BMS3Bbin16]|nr:hypothetical protein BMS3Bbin16_00185 [archaeon BMS3Bbin16]